MTRPIGERMPRAKEPDLFATEAQPDLFGDDAPTPVYRADPDEVRAELHKILAEARAAERMPWEPTRVTLYRTIFSQMTNWLPAFLEWSAIGRKTGFHFC